MSAYLEAAQPPAFVWMRPDSDPYRGSFDDAVTLFAAKGLATRWILEHLTREAGARCRVRELRPGERFAAMTFGRDRAVENVVADTARWPLYVPRTAEECTDGLGNALVTPTACGNISFEFVPPDYLLFGAAQPSGLLVAPPSEAVAGESWPPAASGGWIVGGEGEQGVETGNENGEELTPGAVGLAQNTTASVNEPNALLTLALALGAAAFIAHRRSGERGTSGARATGTRRRLVIGGNCGQ